MTNKGSAHSDLPELNVIEKSGSIAISNVYFEVTLSYLEVELES
jgi:hypothetical protein